MVVKLVPLYPYIAKLLTAASSILSLISALRSAWLRPPLRWRLTFNAAAVMDEVDVSKFDDEFFIVTLDLQYVHIVYVS
jgi:hypothetical protein